MMLHMRSRPAAPRRPRPLEPSPPGQRPWWRRFALLLGATLAFTAALGQAQEVKRIVVLPFDAPSTAEAYRLGLATGLQRSLNVIQNVYVPPVGDTLLLTQRLAQLQRLSASEVAEAYGAEAVVSGRISADGGSLVVLLGFAGPSYPEVAERTVTVPAEPPRRVLGDVTNAVISELGLSISGDDRRQIDAVVQQAPSLPSLKAVGDASLRLPQAPLADLVAAADLDPESSWVLSEKARALGLRGEAGQGLELADLAVQTEPNDIEALIVHGNLLLAAGDEAAALERFEAALAINSGHALALLGRGNLAAEAGERLSALEAALESYPRLADAYLDLAALQAEESGQRALQTLRRGAERIPDSVALRRAVVRQAVNLGDPAGGLVYLRQELARDEARSPALYSVALQLPQPDFLEQAREIFREGREQFPESVSLAVAAARLESQAGEAAAAEEMLRQALELSPDDLELINQLAIAQAQQGEFDEARATLERVAESNDILQANLAQVYLQAGQNRAAAQVLEPLLERHPNDAELYTYYGVALGRTGALQQARDALEQALSLDPDLELADRALRDVEQQAELTRGEPVEALNPEASMAFEAGLAALDRGDFGVAAAEFERGLEAQESALIAFYHGYSLQRAGEQRRAIASYQQALAEFADSDIVLNNLGFAYVSVGRYDLALDTLRRARELNPRNVDVHLNLGLTYYALDRFGPAIEAFEEAIALNPDLESQIGQALDEARRRAEQ